MSKFNLISRAFGLMLLLLGLLNCSSPGGDNKPPPPPVVYHTVTWNKVTGGNWSLTSLQVKDGEDAVSNLTLDAGYSNPITTSKPNANVTLAQGLTPGLWVCTVHAVNANTEVSLSLTPPSTPTFTISGKSGASGATATLTPGGITSGTDAGGFYHLTGVANGTYKVKMSLLGFVFDPLEKTVTVSGADVTDVNFTATFASPTVEMAIFVYDHDSAGNPNIVIQAQSLIPMTTGTTFTCLVRRPGESNFTFLNYNKVDSSMSGMYGYIRLHDGLEFYDILPDGTKKYWNPGVAVYKEEIVTTQGVKTSVIAKVPVLMGTGLIFGPLQQAVVSPDGKSIQLLGSFPTPPVAVLGNPNGGYSLIFPTLQGQNYAITVPSGTFGSRLYLMVTSGYPDAECSSVYVDIPPH